MLSQNEETNKQNPHHASHRPPPKKIPQVWDFEEEWLVVGFSEVWLLHLPVYQHPRCSTPAPASPPPFLAVQRRTEGQTQPPHTCSLLSLMVVSGIAKPPPYPLPAPYKNVFHFFFKQEKGAKASNGGRGVQSDIFIQIFDFLIYYI